jgi:hypothetical protein
MEPTTDQSFLEMHVDYDGGNILIETTRWARFMSIIGFIGVGLFALAIVVIAFAGNAVFNLYTQYVPNIESFAGLIIIGCVVILAVFAYLVYLLFRFATLTRRGLETQDQVMFNRGLQALKINFIINGIFALLGLIGNLLSIRNLF